MKLGQKIAVGNCLSVLCLLACGIVGFWGVRSLSHYLSYITGPAWDTADGAMDGIICLEAQMIAARNVTLGVDVEQNAKLLAEKREETKEGFQTMLDAGQLTAEEVAQVRDRQHNYYLSLDRYLAAFENLQKKQATLAPAADRLRSAFAVATVDQDSSAAAAQRLFLEQQQHLALLFQADHRDEARRALADSPVAIAEALHRLTPPSETLDSARQVVADNPSAAFPAYQTQLGDYLRTFDEFQTSQANYDRDAAALLSFMLDLNETVDAKIDDFLSSIASAQSWALSGLLASLVLGAILAALSGWIVYRAVVTPVLAVVEFSKDIAAGDLNRRLNFTGSDEIGQMSTSLNKAVEITAQTMQQVRETAERQTHAVDHILEVLQRVSVADYSRTIEIHGDDAIGRLADGLRQFFQDKQQREAEAQAAQERERRMLEERAEEERRQNQREQERAAEERRRLAAQAELERQQAETERARKEQEVAKERAQADRERREAEELQRKVDAILRSVDDAANGNDHPTLDVRGTDAIGRLADGLRRFYGERATAKARELATQERERLAAKTLQTKVDQLLEVVQEAANGNLTVQSDIQGDEAIDELAGGMNKMFHDLRSIISEIRESSRQFSDCARTFSESSQSLAIGAQTQSHSVEQIVGSIQDLVQSIEQVRSEARQADEQARHTAELAAAGNSAVTESSAAMSLISNSSKQIEEISAVISEIAGQTNLLALNAAIEAARAGEHGLGFAVVADEVRKLAERANSAAREIGSLIREATERIDAGVELSQRTKQSLGDIIQGVGTTAASLTHIVSATDQQSRNSDHIRAALTNIQRVTEASSAGAEEMAASSEQLGAQAEALQNLVSRFRVQSASREGRATSATASW